jgi:hypothetical protein
MLTCIRSRAAHSPACSWCSIFRTHKPPAPEKARCKKQKAKVFFSFDSIINLSPRGVYKIILCFPAPLRDGKELAWRAQSASLATLGWGYNFKTCGITPTQEQLRNCFAISSCSIPPRKGAGKKLGRSIKLVISHCFCDSRGDFFLMRRAV